eukprot:SM000012S25399  [mRNA]  locus=s12:814352:819161:- [translate_table: standard]
MTNSAEPHRACMQASLQLDPTRACRRQRTRPPSESSPVHDCGRSSSSGKACSIRRRLSPPRPPVATGASRVALRCGSRLGAPLSLTGLLPDGSGQGIPRWVLRALEVSGDGRFWIPAPLAIWLAPQSPRLPPRLRWFAFLTFAAYLVDLAVIGVIKALDPLLQLLPEPKAVQTRRNRRSLSPRPPATHPTPSHLLAPAGHNVVVSVDKWSFPSGHASRTILTASLCFLQWPLLAAMLPPPLDGPLVFVFATIWAVSTSTSRVLLGRHYFLDVIAGALLGVAEALATELIMSASPRTTAALQSLATSCYHRDAGCRLERFSFAGDTTEAGYTTEAGDAKDDATEAGVRMDDSPPFAPCNKVGQPRAALPTLRSYAFRNRGPGMVWDHTTQQLEEPRADERERALGFQTGMTAAPELTERQRRKLLANAMDLRAVTWSLTVCLAAQRSQQAAWQLAQGLYLQRAARAGAGGFVGGESRASGGTDGAGGPAAGGWAASAWQPRQEEVGAGKEKLPHEWVVGEELSEGERKQFLEKHRATFALSMAELGTCKQGEMHLDADGLSRNPNPSTRDGSVAREPTIRRQ